MPMPVHDLLNRPRFEYIVYPLWRRSIPGWLRPIAEPILSTIYPVQADRQPPKTPEAMASHLLTWQLIPDMDSVELATALSESQADITTVDLTATPTLYQGEPVRIPAQWEPVETVLLSWGTMYPPVWSMQAAMVEAISAVAQVEIVVTTPMWAQAIWLYLARRDRANLAAVRFMVLPTDDIWIRDYGPITGIAPDGQRVAVDPIYAVLPQYPQAHDNGMTAHLAAHRGLPHLPLNMHTEGGNLFSDGQGTLMMTSQIFYSNRHYSRERLLAVLHDVFDFERLIITPRLTLEVTGHIDLMARPVAPDRILVSAATSASTEGVLRQTKRLFERETNAAGQPYQVFELPTPPLYLNWFTHQIRRAYTNSLIVNGRVLVPTYGIASDDAALRIYEVAMPGYEIIPINSRRGINGGGAVHCMTREIPAG